MPSASLQWPCVFIVVPDGRSLRRALLGPSVQAWVSAFPAAQLASSLRQLLAAGQGLWSVVASGSKAFYHEPILPGSGAITAVAYFDAAC